MEVFGSRTLLCLFCMVNLLIMCGANTVRQHVDKRIWNAIFVFQTVFVTGYIIADNVANPLQGGYIGAILGYIFVYVLIFLAWVSWLPNTYLEPDIIYSMQPEGFVIHGGSCYVRGTIRTNGMNVSVLLKNKPPQQLPKTTIPVKFLQVMDGEIFVTAI